MQVEKEKIGIITLYDLLNYGNRLQNYAVEIVLKRLGYIPETIIINKVSLGLIKERIIALLRRKQWNQSWNMMQENEYYYQSLTNIQKKKYKEFLQFTKSHTNISYKNWYKNLPCLWQREYKKFVAGSDQIWNPKAGQALDWEFLTFAPKDKRISIAASFGVNKIEDRVDEIRNYLIGMNNISVREDAGQQIVKELSEKKATVIVDPTLLIDAEEWIKLANKPSFLNDEEKYLLTYFIGEETEQIKYDIKSFSTEKNLVVHKLNCLDDEDLFSSGPAEFLYLFSRAELVLTDSFHACVFAFLFNKPFLVYQRAGKKENMMSRMDTLLSKFSLERKYANSGLPNDIWEHDYTEGYKQLEIERIKAIDFLKKALED